MNHSQRAPFAGSGSRRHIDRDFAAGLRRFTLKGTASCFRTVKLAWSLTP
jgi:hypothetical protein